LKWIAKSDLLIEKQRIKIKRRKQQPQQQHNLLHLLLQQLQARDIRFPSYTATTTIATLASPQHQQQQQQQQQIPFCYKGVTGTSQLRSGRFRSGTLVPKQQGTLADSKMR
jgi:hypothetical protein